MSGHRLISSFFAMVAIVALFQLPVLAQSNAMQSDSALRKLQVMFQREIVAQENTLEVSLENNILNILRINSNQNNSSHNERNDEASVLSAAFVKMMDDDPMLSQVHTIHVEYLNKPNASSSTVIIDTVEFRKNAKGEFPLHAS